MPVTRPYRRTCRQFVDGHYSEGARDLYILHPKYAQDPAHYIRAFLLLSKDVQALFDYVEPADANKPCYSYRIHELLLRSCVEVEANCKAILIENGYAKKPCDMNRRDYQKVEASHRLSSYEVKVPYWRGDAALRRPFAAWASGAPLRWYEAYNAAKHDRNSSFQEATFDHLIDAICAVVALLSSQFHRYDFSPRNWVRGLSGPHNDGMSSAIGGYFRVKFPNDWPEDERYGFDWSLLRNEPDPFATIDYASKPESP